MAIPVQHGDVVLIHEDYYPVLKAPGTNAYCLNVLAGDVRKISAINDPHYDFIAPEGPQDFSPGFQPWEPPTRLTRPERAPDHCYK